MFQNLEDNQLKIQSFLGSKYVTEIRHFVEEWERNLSLV